MRKLIQVNYVAVFVSAIVSMALGFAWYSPMLFGKQWMKEIGMSQDDMKKGANPLMITKTFIAAFVTAYVLAHFIHYAGAYTLVNGVKTGVWAWLGFVATVGFMNTLYGKKSWRLFYIDYGYHLVSLMIMGAILALWF